MDNEDSRLIATRSIMATNEARDRLHAIMTSDMAEAIEQIGQTLEACNAKKVRLLNQIDEVSRTVETVRNECGCIDTTIA
jgi:Spy/CpxP family protein refolding chaperone